MSQKQGWLIYRSHDLAANRVFADRLVAAAAARHLVLHIVPHETLRFGVRADGLYVQTDVAPGLPDFAIARAVDPFLSQHLELMGIRVFNRAAVGAMCNDKAWTYQAVARLGIPMLPTRFSDLAGLAALSPPEWPVVIKAVGGRSGKQVHLASNAEEYAALCSALPAGRYVAQPLCGQPGVDIRVFVIAHKVVAAIRRTAEQGGAGGFRANFSMGGSAAVHLLSDDEYETVMRIVHAFSFDYVGIDFLLDAQGHFLFNEIEDAVGSRTLSICTRIDIADLFLAHIAEDIEKAAL